MDDIDEDVLMFEDLLLIGSEFVDYKDTLTYLNSIKDEALRYKESLEKEKTLSLKK